MNVEPRPIIHPIPDDNTSEAIMYGPAYKFAKSSKWYLDELEENADDRIEELIDQIIDLEWAAMVMNRNPRIIFARNPPVSDPDKIRDLWTLRQIVNYGSSKPMIEVFRTTSRLYSTMQGVDQHAQQYIREGVAEPMWKAATIGFNVPIEYETVRTIKNQEYRSSVEDLESYYYDMDSEERRREADRIEREARDYARSFDEDEEEDEPRPVPEFDIYREYDVADDDPEDEDVTSDDYWTDEPEEEEFVVPVPSSPVFDSVMGIAYELSHDPVHDFLHALEDFAQTMTQPAVTPAEASVSKLSKLRFKGVKA